MARQPKGRRPKGRGIKKLADEAPAAGADQQGERPPSKLEMAQKALKTPPGGIPGVTPDDADALIAELADIPNAEELARYGAWGHALNYIRNEIMGAVPGDLGQQLREIFVKIIRGDPFTDESRKEVLGVLSGIGARVQTVDDVCALEGVQATPETLAQKVKGVLEQNVEAKGVSNERRTELGIRFFMNILKRQRDPTLYYGENPTPEQAREVFEYHQQRYRTPATINLFSRYSRGEITADQLDEELAKVIFTTTDNPELMKRFFGREFTQHLRLKRMQDQKPAEEALLERLTGLLTTFRTGAYLDNSTSQQRDDARSLFASMLNIPELDGFFTGGGKSYRSGNESNNKAIDNEVAKKLLGEPTLVAKIMQHVLTDTASSADQMLDLQKSVAGLYASGVINVQGLYMEARRLRNEGQDYAGSAEKLRSAKSVVDQVHAETDTHPPEYAIVYAELGLTMLVLASREGGPATKKQKFLEAAKICEQALVPPDVDDRTKQFTSHNLHKAYAALASISTGREKTTYEGEARKYQELSADQKKGLKKHK